MKKHLTWANIDLNKVDFIKGAENVYRTNDFIVKQVLHSSWDSEKMIMMIGSEDTYYARTYKRDAEYNLLFEDRGRDINGKRIRTAFYTRKYID